MGEKKCLGECNKMCGDNFCLLSHMELRLLISDRLIKSKGIKQPCDIETIKSDVRLRILNNQTYVYSGDLSDANGFISRTIGNVCIDFHNARKKRPASFSTLSDEFNLETCSVQSVFDIERRNGRNRRFKRSVMELDLRSRIAEASIFYKWEVFQGGMPRRLNDLKMDRNAKIRIVIDSLEKDPDFSLGLHFHLLVNVPEFKAKQGVVLELLQEYTYIEV